MSQPTLDHSQTKQYANKLKNNGVIVLTGDEKIKYLQGQITADVNKLTDENALLGCHCDFKGKIWSVFYTFAWQDSILLITHNSVLDKSLAELNKYGVFAKVEITNQSDKWQITGGSGSLFENAIIELFDELPVGDQVVKSDAYGLVMSVTRPEQRYLVLQPNNAAKQLNCDVAENDKLWEIANIKAGLGDIREATINEYVPQMLNLQALQAIDFEKGCYMGQEVVARTKYLGRNKRAGFILKAESENDDLTGEQLEYQIGDNWRPGGKILRSGANLGQTWIFAVLAIDTEVGSAFRVKSSPNTIFVAQALPYPLQ
ncbi:tRNA-modifying protein YgfZ [Paraglaciecola arctica]|uniref:tRNA-modifying protein ygfZ n=1 Tax=Paraglaciecola arctica BSs20135 TaxID=493475 RepID=K6YAH4_9ALTE|nr:tRNA-modifying protein YgfZ [Paraglaciecola arctica]GAC20941.1 tRNA-modifying protein ygfZ [Paraglaciecola arctica BSs20135]